MLFGDSVLSMTDEVAGAGAGAAQPFPAGDVESANDTPSGAVGCEDTDCAGVHDVSSKLCPSASLRLRRVCSHPWNTHTVKQQMADLGLIHGEVNRNQLQSIICANGTTTTTKDHGLLPNQTEDANLEHIPQKGKIDS